MTSALLILRLPEILGHHYQDGIQRAFPDVKVTWVDHVSKADPYLADAEILVTHGPFLADRADHVLGNMPKLKWVQGIGTGVDNIADRPALAADVTVTCIHGVHGNPMCEAAFAAMLSFSRRIPRTVRNKDARKWENWPSSLLAGKTIGIFGVGSIAETIAPRCKAFGMTVIGISSSNRSVPGFDRMMPRERLIEAVSEVDYLLLLTPYTPDTHHIVDAKVFAAMKPKSILVNQARGGIVDEAALLDALREGRIAGAALDVFAVEPLPEDSPFWDMENVVITCHQAAMHDGSVRANVPIINENMRRFLAGDLAGMRHVVRPARVAG